VTQSKRLTKKKARVLHEGDQHMKLSFVQKKK